MTVYIKYENDKLITAPNKPVDVLLSEGYEESTEEFVSNYFYKQYIREQIAEIEQSQLRAIREIALNKNIEFAMEKLQALDSEIAELRAML